MQRLFVPGWGAPPAIYSRALGGDWRVVRSPTFAQSGGALAAHVDALVAELDWSSGPAVVGGHSMGGAVAVLAALERPEHVSRLVLVAPAGLPLTKPVHESVREFGRQLRAGAYPRIATGAAVASVLRAPRAAARLARAVRQLDLTAELGRLAQLGVPCGVVGCTTDSLITVDHCRRIARLAGGGYRELGLPGGHMWMLTERATFASVVA
jgi:pimeloyl-ACP methyl ester carboxylesterase